MKRKENPEIGYFDIFNFLNKEDDLILEIKKKSIDIILDCSSNKIKKSFLFDIISFQRKIKRCIVIILPLEKQKNYPDDLNIVPTKREALDFIFFEQIQRKIGF